MDSGSPGPRPRWCQRPGHGLGRAPGPAGADDELVGQQHRPGSPVDAFGSLQRGGGGGFRLFRRESRHLGFLRAGFGVGCSCCLWALVCRVISELELAWPFCSCTWGGSAKPDGMEFLKPNCSVPGGIRSVDKAWILGALARGNDGASALATAFAGLQGLQELMVDLGENCIGPGAQGAALEACRGVGGGLRELRNGSCWFRSASGDWRRPSKLSEA